MSVSVQETTAPRVRGRADTRRRLLEAAASLIASEGYDKATLAGIAARAGLTTGAVYSTFGSKWDLLRAVVADRSHALSLGGRSVDRVAGELAKAVDRQGARQLLILQLEIHLLALRHPELLDDLVVEGHANRAQLAAEIISQAEGKLALSAPDLATLLSSMVQGLQLTQLFYPDAVSKSLYAFALRRLLD